MKRNELMKELGYNLVYNMKDVEACLSGIETTFFKCEQFPCWVKRIKDEYFDYNADILVISFDSVECTDSELEELCELKNKEDMMTDIIKKYITDNLKLGITTHTDWEGYTDMHISLELDGKTISSSSQYMGRS